jgi:hypothetical protein
MSLIYSTATRVSANTADELNEQFHRDLESRLVHFAAHPEQIDARLAELDREWDIERALETGSASLSLFGLLMGITRRRGWLVVPLAVQAFFLQHALQGWCPPLPALRRAGFRTSQQIEAERHGLKALRGDFERAGDLRTHPDQSAPLADAVES